MFICSVDFRHRIYKTVMIIHYLTLSLTNNTGTYLVHNSMALANNSAVFISDVGSTVNNRLQCTTDRMPCCSSNLVGEWFFPGDGGMVPALGSGPNMATTFYRSRGDDGTVNLNRVSDDVMMPTGQYCCVVPDATGVMQWACAMICM